jgi:hypothetical protein
MSCSPCHAIKGIKGQKTPRESTLRSARGTTMSETHNESFAFQEAGVKESCGVKTRLQ